MNSTPTRHRSPFDEQAIESLLDRADEVIRRALHSGALQPIRTEQCWLDDGALRFSVRWVSSLALKDRARVDTVIRRKPDFNPFLPPEADLTVAELGDAHLVVLNKFPVIDRHLLIVTRQFEDQHTPLSRADFDALAAVIAEHGGLGFYNGGRTAGASQAHSTCSGCRKPQPRSKPFFRQIFQRAAQKPSLILPCPGRTPLFASLTPSTRKPAQVAKRWRAHSAPRAPRSACPARPTRCRPTTCW